MKQYNVDFQNSQITFNKSNDPNLIEHVMMDWEDDLMKGHARVVCYNKGDNKL